LTKIAGSALEIPSEMPYSFLISQQGDNYYARDSFGRIKYRGSDASTVIQSAINALTSGGKIFIKAGTYDMPTPPQGDTIVANTYIVNSKDNLTIQGAGRGKTIINIPGQTLTKAPNFFFSSGYDHVCIKGLSIIGDSVMASPGGGAISGFGIWVEGDEDLVIENNDIINMAQAGIEVSVPRTGYTTGPTSTDVHIINNRIIQFYNTGIGVTNVHRVWVEDNYVSATDTPIAVGAAATEDVYQIYIKRNMLDWFGQAGMPTTIQNVMGLTIFAGAVNNVATHDITVSDNTLYPGPVDLILITQSGAGTGKLLYNIEVAHNKLIGSGLGMTGQSYGIHLSDPAGEWTVKRNINIHNNKLYACAYGLYLDTFDNVVIEENEVSNGVGTYDGMYIISSNFVKVQNNLCQYNGGAGIRFSGGLYADIAGNTALRNAAIGFNIVDLNNSKVMDNFAIDNDYNDTNSYDGFLFNGADDNFISGNKAYVTTAGRYQRYGIYDSFPSTNNVIVNNDVRQGGRTGNLYSGVTTSIIQRNKGYVTENSGTATILSGQSSVTFAHGLAGTPTIVTLGATHAEVADAIWSADPTNITITVPSNVTANRNISWYAEYKP